MSSQYPFPRCSDSKPKVTWLFHAAKVQQIFETTKFYGIFSVTITIISTFHAVLGISSLGHRSVEKTKVLKKGKEVMVRCRILTNIALFICACGKKVESLYKFIGMQGIYKTTWLERLLPPELPIYYTAVPSSNESAVFRTTAEISANLVFRGNIKHPMDLRALGRVMSAMGYVSKRLGKTRARGFLVIENQVNSSTALELAKRIREEEMSADKPSVPSVF